MQHQVDEDFTADVAIELEGIIERLKIRDWASNPDAQNRMKAAIDDLLYDSGVPLTHEEMDYLMDKVIEVAKHRDYI